MSVYQLCLISSSCFFWAFFSSSNFKCRINQSTKKLNTAFLSPLVNANLHVILLPSSFFFSTISFPVRQHHHDFIEIPWIPGNHFICLSSHSAALFWFNPFDLLYAQVLYVLKRHRSYLLPYQTIVLCLFSLFYIFTFSLWLLKTHVSFKHISYFVWE